MQFLQTELLELFCFHILNLREPSLGAEGFFLFLFFKGSLTLCVTVNLIKIIWPLHLKMVPRHSTGEKDFEQYVSIFSDQPNLSCLP